MNTQNPEHKIPEEILHLIAKSRSQMLKAEDQNQLNAWLNEHPENKEEMAHFQQILDRVHWQALANKLDLPEAWEKLEAQIQTKRKSRINLVFALRWAALFVLLAGLGFLLLYEGDHLNKQEEEPLVEVLPERMLKASLKLADGSLIALDTAQMQLKESAFEIQNQPGEKLSYSKNEAFKQKASQAVFHELIVPAGARYQLVLADGTKVWMNAASKLTYPVSFSDAERRVKLEGEAYFEVMSSAVPFIVEAGKQEIRVLGTSFNVSAYHEDANFETTLVSGKVLVKTEKMQ